MPKRSIVFAVYDGFFNLDLAGAAAVFASAARFDADVGYEIIYASRAGGRVAPMGGPPVETITLHEADINASTTIIVVGSEAQETQRALSDVVLVKWLQENAAASQRISSVCTGAFILAKAGLLKGKVAATHWRACDALARLNSVGDVNRDAIYVEDGKIWTSAGVTAGIDMALAMVEADLGRNVADQIARQLVIHGRRAGHQSQFSDMLDAQAKAGAPFAKLVDWIESTLPAAITAEDMSSVMGMSPRSFFRRFKTQTGQTPASFLNDMRLDRARQLLVENMRVSEIGGRSGFESDAGFRSAFRRKYGMSPSAFRQLHAPIEPANLKSR